METVPAHISETEMSVVVYSTQRNGFDPGCVYRNPHYFEKANAVGVDRIVVIGDWPNVVEAYRSLGVEVVSDIPIVVTSSVQADYPSDEEMRKAIRAKTGKSPHWKTKREGLIEQYKGLT
jgi:hypothetical protein